MKTKITEFLKIALCFCLYRVVFEEPTIHQQQNKDITTLVKYKFKFVPRIKVIYLLLVLTMPFTFLIFGVHGLYKVASDLDSFSLEINYSSYYFTQPLSEPHPSKYQAYKKI